MRPGQVFIIPIIQESWINALAENELGRIRLREWPAAEFGRANGVSRIGACGTVRVAAALEREGIGAADQCQLPDGSVVIKWARSNIERKNCRVSASIVKTRC